MKQGFPPTEFEFSPRVVALLRFSYDCVVDFYKTCGLQEHGVSGSGGLLAAMEGVANRSSNPNPSSASLFEPRQGSMSLGPVLESASADDLVFKAWFYPQGVVPPAPFLFTILRQLLPVWPSKHNSCINLCLVRW